jgi:hypothetical protein
LEEEEYGGTRAEANEELSSLGGGGRPRRRTRMGMDKDTHAVLKKALVISLVVTIFSLPQISLISLKNHSFSVSVIFTTYFVFNLVVIMLLSLAYEYAIHRRVPKAQILVGGIVGSLIVSTILSLSWINNILAYPVTFVALTAVLTVTYWSVRELTEPRAYRNVLFFIIVIVIIYLGVKYVPTLFGAIKISIPSSNTPVVMTPIVKNISNVTNLTHK